MQKRFRENSEKYSKDAARALEEDALAMARDGLSVSEISEYLGISIEKDKYTVNKLIREGRLEGKPAEVKKKEMNERAWKVCEAVKAGHGKNPAKHLGMKYTEVRYALKKLEGEGRIRMEGKFWVAA